MILKASLKTISWTGRRLCQSGESRLLQKPNSSQSNPGVYKVHILEAVEENGSSPAEPPTPIHHDRLSGGGVYAGVQLLGDLVHDDEDGDLDQRVPIAFQKI